jgi:hypothetical protein
MTIATVKPEYRGDRLIRDAATAIFIVLIALLGAVMMTVTSSPLVKGAAFLWLPAALQLIAGVWLGPLRGLIAGGIGAQAAGVIAYGGWAFPDVIMNLIAGGIANSWLPAVMFRGLRIDPSFGSKPEALWRPAVVLLLVTILLLILAATQLFLGDATGITGGWGYVLPIVVVLALPLVWRSITPITRGFYLALIVAVISCLLSAAIGTWGAVVGGQTWQAAVLGTGVGWFLGDTASAILGIYMLAQFTERARLAGFAPLQS